MQKTYTPKIFAGTISSGSTSIGTGVDLVQTWDNVILEMPEFASGGTFYIQGSNNNSTFKRLHIIDQADGAPNVIQIAQGFSAMMIPIAVGFRYYKVENTTGVTDAITTYNFH